MEKRSHGNITEEDETVKTEEVELVRKLSRTSLAEGLSTSGGSQPKRRKRDQSAVLRTQLQLECYSFLRRCARERPDYVVVGTLNGNQYVKFKFGDANAKKEIEAAWATHRSDGKKGTYRNLSNVLRRLEKKGALVESNQQRKTGVWIFNDDIKINVEMLGDNDDDDDDEEERME